MADDQCQHYESQSAGTATGGGGLPDVQSVPFPLSKRERLRQKAQESADLGSQLEFIVDKMLAVQIREMYDNEHELHAESTGSDSLPTAGVHGTSIPPAETSPSSRKAQEMTDLANQLESMGTRMGELIGQLCDIARSREP